MVNLIMLAVIMLAVIGSDRKMTAFFRMSFIAIFLFAALRYMYGNDYLSYMNSYHIIQQGRIVFGQEPLYLLLNRISPSFYLLIALISAAFVGAMYWLIMKHVPVQFAWIGVFVLLINPYIFLVNLSAIRQCMAMVFFVFAADFLYNRKPACYFLLIAIAAMFHKSAWVLLPVYFVVTPRAVKRMKIVGILLAVYLLLNVVDLNQLLQFGASLFNDANYTFFSQQDVRNSLRATILTSLYFFYVLFNLPKMQGKALVYCKLYLIGTIFGVLAYRFSMFTRLQMYFDVFAVVALPMIFKAVQDRGAIVIDSKNALFTMWECFNKYAMPVLLLTIFLLRYYSFFANPLWRRFREYQTILSLL